MMRIVFVILLLLPLSACTPSSPDSDASIEQSNADNSSGTRISMSVPRSQISIAERVWIIDTCVWSDGTPRTFVERDFSKTDWALIETTTEPMRLGQSEYSIVRRSLIEPFLPGDYSIPPASVRVDETEQVVSTEPISVGVLGVLTDEGAGDLNAIAEFTVAPDADQDRSRILWIGFVAGAGLIALAVYVSLRKTTDISRSIFDELAIIRDDQEANSDGYDRLGRVLDRLDPRLKNTTEFAEMIRLCDQARFAPDQERRVQMPPHRVAGHALELLGHDASSGDVS
jgi:hypothetical protein